MRKQTLHRRRIKHVASKAERQIECTVTCLGVQHQIILRAVSTGVDACRGQTRQSQRIDAVVDTQIEHHLKQRRLQQIALRLQCIDDVAKRHVLMRMRGQHPIPHLLRKLRKSLARAQIAADHQRVDEESDNALRLDLLTPRGRNADTNIRRAGVSIQQHVEGGEQGHEERHALAGMTGTQTLRDAARHGARHMPPGA
ncbi:hypothetical protein R75461_04623 [Paraburkholderia nemoris]|nr:hypothetical protein R75461_04623 [Paraburkholderia nemoris]